MGPIYNLDLQGLETEAKASHMGTPGLQDPLPGKSLHTADPDAFLRAALCTSSHQCRALEAAPGLSSTRPMYT